MGINYKIYTSIKIKENEKASIGGEMVRYYQ